MVVQFLDAQVTVPAVAHSAGALAVAQEAVEFAVARVLLLGNGGQVPDARIQELGQQVRQVDEHNTYQVHDSET